MRTEAGLFRWWKLTTIAAVIVAIGSLSALAIVVAIPIRFNRITDERLIGTWQSDADRTIAGIRERKPVDDKQEAGLRKLFGKLRVTYNPTTIKTEMDGVMDTNKYTDTYKYEVLGKDKHSVVIREFQNMPFLQNELHLELSEFTVIQFDGPDSYWVISKIGDIREYFKRVQ